MTIFDVDIDALRGGSPDMERYRGQVVPVVNLASTVEVNGPGRHR